MVCDTWQIWKVAVKAIHTDELKKIIHEIQHAQIIEPLTFKMLSKMQYIVWCEINVKS
jgi:hypothetical protein